MRTILLAASALALAMPAMALNDAPKGLNLQIGRLTVQGKLATQTIEVQNHTSIDFSWVGISCGFFKDQELIAVGGGGVSNLKAGDTSYTNAIALDAPGATSAKCHIEQAGPQ
jgi:hypothetical protein